MAGDAATASFIAAINGLAQISGNSLLLFPELGALSYDILRRPNGAWATSPLMVIATPFAAGLIGTLITRHLPYGVLAVLVAVFSAILIIRVLGSPVAPAISAALLPLTLNETSWLYSPSVLVGCVSLAGISVIRRWRRSLPVQTVMETGNSTPAEQDLSWVPFFAVFLVVAASGAVLTGMRFLLFPPLAVIAYEMFAHFDSCPWARRPLLIPVICGLTAMATLIIIGWLGTGVLAAALAVMCGAAALRIFQIHFPPAIAVAVLPFIMPDPGYRYPVAVVIGTILVCVIFFLWRATRRRTI